MIFFEPSTEGAAGSIQVRQTETKCVNKSIKNVLARFMCADVGLRAHVHVCVLVGSEKLSLHLSCFQKKEKEKKSTT